MNGKQECCCEDKDSFSPKDLLCEYAKQPLGIGTERPRFTWENNCNERGQFQTAYRVLVASNIGLLSLNHADMWDSGRVESRESVSIVYDGKPLKSCKRYFWKVCVWERTGINSSFSDVSWFETGLLLEKDWKSQWIGCAEFGSTAPMFRKEFILDKKVSRARAYITGLGYYELSINGSKIGDYILDPAWTDYSKRVLYTTYDVTESLKEGSNAVGVMLGAGRFVSSHLKNISTILQMILQLNITFEDGEERIICSDVKSGWKVICNGPIIFNSIYDGETYDATLEMPGWDTAGFDMEACRVSGQKWLSPILIEPPGGRMEAQSLEPIKVIMDLKPLKIYRPASGVYVYDMGQNICGWVKLKVEGKKGTKIILRFSELIGGDQLINRENLRTAKAVDTYILKGGSEELYEPRFTYHGFRYVQVEGYPGEPKLESVTGRVIRSSVESIGRFICSNELINKIQQCAVWTEAGNLMGIPTDCPQRDERMGWLNDATVRVEEAVYNFNMVRFFEKWEKDIADTQGMNTGVIADTAPFHYGRRPADAVCSSYLLIPWFLYLHYGDIRILETHYEGMKSWTEYLELISDNYIVYYSIYGDWASPALHSIHGSLGSGALSAITPGELMSTGYFYYNCIILSKVARILRKEADEKRFGVLAERIKKAFNDRFWDKGKNQYATGSQASNVFPLYLGIVPEKNKKAVVDNLVKDIMEVNRGHLTTGNLCSRYIMDVLTEAGRVDVAYVLATQKTYPSWGYMIENGATTIWERWEYVISSEQAGMASHNHPMYASISAWFYKMLAGIQVEEEGPGFERITIKPHVPEELRFVEASLKTVRGVVEVSWFKYEEKIVLNVVIPFNSSAKVFVPKIGKKSASISENRRIIWKQGKMSMQLDEMKGQCENSEYVILEVGSGAYSFECT